ACGLIDDAGATAPWREYLALHDADRSDPSTSGYTADPEGAVTLQEDETLNVVHGRLRLGGIPGVVRGLLRYLRDAGNEFKPLFIRRLAARLTRMTTAELVERMAQRADVGRAGAPRITRRA